MPKKLIIDGQDFTQDSVFDHIISYSRSNDNAESSKFIEKITFNNAAFDYLNKIFFTDRDRKHECEMSIMPKNCDKTYNFKIGFRDVKKCDCSIECTPISDQAYKYDYLKKTLWYGNGFETAYEHFHVYFCQGFTFINVLFTVLYPILVQIILIMQLIDEIIDLGDIPTLDDLNELVSGCGNYHLGYSLKEVFEHHAPLAGLTFQSSILLADPYDKTVFVMADGNNGYDDNQNVKFDPQNAYGISILTLGQLFKKLHNAELWIEGDRLRYENILIYETLDVELVDMDTLDIPNCEQYDVSKGYAFAEMKYGIDFLDQDGNQASDLYNDVIEYNSPPEDWQKGSLDYTIQDFSPIRYQHDKYDNNFWSDLVNQLRYLLKGRDKDMLLSNARCNSMKVFIWDGVSERKDAHTRRYNIGETYYEYNYDYFINENPLGSPLIKPNLYDRFLWVNDPREFYFIERDDFEFQPCDFCEAIDLLELYGTRCGIKKELDGLGMANEITVNFDTMEIEVKKPYWRIKA